ncbi:unnamed protein product [Darwinula stevensoni]|uniref:Lamin n=1 Tax=Darwinula stevensoni TaxID=69355 RepID=A0A7R9AAX1_9CRUS|nr:unnamed protein product [Darwinula stevensoni]CAG0898744.1 unnamed protein product [Darwinula stevensoni]
MSASKSKSKTTKVTETRSSTSMSSAASSSATHELGSPRKSRVTTSSRSSGAFVRSGSPLSPTRLSRIEEKEQLVSLNDRLAAYIDWNRNLKNENQTLRVQVETSEERFSREVTRLRDLYDSELSDARRVLDDISKDKAELQIQNDTLRTENNELREELDHKTRDLAAKERALNTAEARAADSSNRANQAIAERKKAVDDLKAAEAELDKLRKQNVEAKKQLETETLRRVDLENRLQTLREELDFAKQVHTQEVSELRTSKQVEISEVDSRLQREYEDKLQDILTELRQEQQYQLEESRADIEGLYKRKLDDLQNHYARASEASATKDEELRSSRIHIDNLTSRVSGLEDTINTLNKRIRDLEKALRDEQDTYAKALADKDNELTAMHNQMSATLHDYHDILDTKISLEAELRNYRAMLEAEETRYCLIVLWLDLKSPEGNKQSSRRSSVTPAQARPAKRARRVLQKASQFDYTIKSSAKSDVHITEVNVDGNYIELSNKGQGDIGIGGWVLTHSTQEGDGDHETSYKFHHSLVLKAGASVKVWSANAGATHSPPETLVMKGERWFIGDTMRTSLINTQQDEVAEREAQKERQYSTYETESVGEHLHHQTGDPRRPEGCLIM